GSPSHHIEEVKAMELMDGVVITRLSGDAISLPSAVMASDEEREGPSNVRIPGLSNHCGSREDKQGILQRLIRRFTNAWKSGKSASRASGGAPEDPSRSPQGGGPGTETKKAYNLALNVGIGCRKTTLR
ncbi:hypothetical protein MTO96_039445, partial [Rhipicephalus appendiculatus]